MIIKRKLYANFSEEDRKRTLEKFKEKKYPITKEHDGKTLYGIPVLQMTSGGTGIGHGTNMKFSCFNSDGSIAYYEYLNKENKKKDKN